MSKNTDDKYMTWMFTDMFLRKAINGGNFTHISFTPVAEALKTNAPKIEQSEKLFQKASYDSRNFILTIESNGNIETYTLPEDYRMEFVDGKKSKSKFDRIALWTDSDMFMFDANKTA